MPTTTVDGKPKYCSTAQDADYGKEKRDNDVEPSVMHPGPALLLVRRTPSCIQQHRGDDIRSKVLTAAPLVS